MELKITIGNTEHEKVSPYPQNAGANKLFEQLFDYLHQNNMEDYKETMFGCTTLHFVLLSKYAENLNEKVLESDIQEKILKENIEFLPVYQIVIEEKPHKYLNVFLHTKEENDFDSFFVLSKDPTKEPLKVIVEYVGEGGLAEFWKKCDVDFNQ